MIDKSNGLVDTLNEVMDLYGECDIKAIDEEGNEFTIKHLNWRKSDDSIRVVLERSLLKS